ncbi:aurora-like kinase [Raphidocelis subcapitata]|uniref:Aurora-like kinase n=1 Tax=Raphidocelis subcapitata TaxID=307507 RepID=A0A2V0PDM2_9CHLO|nr:aurora-like kinase [Raphidocelis subcapitata]|eukprot:GBF97062.1 aurora-like kinase [Raphidocelis subcapitata]
MAGGQYHASPGAALGAAPKGATGGGTSGDAVAAAAALAGQLLLSMDDFADYREIGRGKDAVVYSATCPKLGGAPVVLKVYEKAGISAVKHRAVRREARIMRFVTGAGVPNVCRYIGAFQDSRQIYIVMERAQGGDLLESLLAEGRAMTERRAVREVVAPMLTCLAHLHAAGVIHRDIKLENLFVSPTRGVMLGDYGLAVCVHEEKPISPVGTLEYMPPEILRLPATDLVLSGAVRADDVTPITERVDCWSLGVTVFELVTGRSPFEGASKQEIRAAILAHAVRPLPGFLTRECADWLGAAMQPDAARRPGALELLRHPWVLRNLMPEAAAAAATLRVATPRMLPAAPAAAPAPENARREAPGAAAPGEAAAADAAAAAASSPPLAVAKAAGKANGGPTSPEHSGAGGIPAYVPGAGGSSSSAGGGHVAGVGGGGSSGSSGSAGTAAMAVASAASGSAASVPSAPGSPGPSGNEPGGGAAYLGGAPQPRLAAAAAAPQLAPQQAAGGKGKHGSKLLNWMCLAPAADPSQPQ